MLLFVTRRASADSVWPFFCFVYSFLLLPWKDALNGSLPRAGEVSIKHARISILVRVSPLEAASPSL